MVLNHQTGREPHLTPREVLFDHRGLSRSVIYRLEAEQDPAARYTGASSDATVHGGFGTQ